MPFCILCKIDLCFNQIQRPVLFLSEHSSQVSHGSESSKQLNLSGDWTIQNYAQIKQQIKPYAKTVAQYDQISLDGIQQLDTVGVLLMADIFGVEYLQQALQASQLGPERRAMIEAVIQALPHAEQVQAPKRTYADFFAQVGKSVTGAWQDFLQWHGFLGMVLLSFWRTVFIPKKWRYTSLVANVDASGFKAAPIVMLLCFMVGAVVAFLGATVLETFGAQVFTVHLVTYSFLREFAIILTAILIAGRTASAYTAQLGSMKVNEEIDALKASGVDQLSVLVLPRVLALVIAMPILTFLGMLAGIFGGMLVAAVSMDISPRLFFDIMNNVVGVKHFLVGIGKAPIFAIVVAITGCLEGFKVSGSAESVGEHTTSSVVKCIFLVILLDALFAIFFMEMGW